MSSKTKNSTLRMLRKICGLTQAELADIIDCARLTVHAIEAGKLKLSEKMADKISLHTGVTETWLLANDCKVQPTCVRYPERPYTREYFDMTRAEICDPRTDPVDTFVVREYIEAFCSDLRGVALQAYRTDSITYLYFKLREFFAEVRQHWKVPRKPLKQAEFSQRLEEERVKKASRSQKGCQK